MCLEVFKQEESFGLMFLKAKQQEKNVRMSPLALIN